MFITRWFESIIIVFLHQIRVSLRREGNFKKEKRIKMFAKQIVVKKFIVEKLKLSFILNRINI